MTEKTKKNEAVLSLAEKILADLEINKDTGIVTEKVSTFEANLPEGLTKELVNQLDDYNVNYVAAGVRAFGTISTNTMSGAKKLAQTTGTLAMGEYNKLNVTCDRTKQFPNTLSESKEPVIKYGHVTATLEVRAGKNSGALKAARAAIAELALEKLKS